MSEKNFENIRVNFCLHKQEWEEYHRICEEQIYIPRKKNYEKNISDQQNNCYHFILYKKTVIVSVAQIELLNEQEAALRRLATDKPYQKQGFAAYLMQILEKWVLLQKRMVLKLHTDAQAEKFYRKLGYVDMQFVEPRDIPPHIIDLGKVLKDEI